MSFIQQEQSIVNLEFIVDEGVAPDLDQAGQFGFDDALEGHNARGSEYYEFNSLCWHSYNDGYARGLTARKNLVALNTVQLDELEFMAQALDDLRSGKVAALASTQMEEDEWIGADFSTSPYLY